MISVDVEKRLEFRNLIVIEDISKDLKISEEDDMMVHEL